jgi:hypothetical protein
LHTVLRVEYLHHPPLVEDAFGAQAVALLRQLNTAMSNADDLAAAAMAHFDKHPDAKIISSLPGLGSLTGARVLAEIGDDRSRFADARSLKAYAGAAPVTRASGKSLTVIHRRVKNQRLAAVGYVWAFAALTASPGARAHYDRRRTAGDWHAAAQGNLFNRLLGCLHHCLDTRQTYNENLAFPAPSTASGRPNPGPLEPQGSSRPRGQEPQRTARGGLVCGPELRTAALTVKGRENFWAALRAAPARPELLASSLDGEPPRPRPALKRGGG